MTRIAMWPLKHTHTHTHGSVSGLVTHTHIYTKISFITVHQLNIKSQQKEKCSAQSQVTCNIVWLNKLMNTCLDFIELLMRSQIFWAFLFIAMFDFFTTSLIINNSFTCKSLKKQLFPSITSIFSCIHHRYCFNPPFEILFHKCFFFNISIKQSI